MMNPLMTGAVCAALAIASSANAQFLYVAESGQDRVVALNAFDSSVVNANFLDIAAAAASVGYTGTTTPIEAMDVGNEIWVTDQNADRVWRFNQDGTFAGQYGVAPTNGQGLLNNGRGFEVVGNTAYFAQGSDASGIGGQGESITTMDITTGTLTGSFIEGVTADTSYNDVLAVNGELYVSDGDSGFDAIERWSTAGGFLGFFAQSVDDTTDFDQPQQIAQRANGDILLAGFSLPAGVYGCAADGTPQGIVSGMDQGPRGVVELADGSIMYTGGIDVEIDGTVVQTGSGLSWRFLTATPVPAPGALAAFGVLGVFARRRRA